MWIRSLGQEDPLEGMATHSSIFAWRILMDRAAWQTTVHAVAESQTQPSDEAQHVKKTVCDFRKNFIFSVFPILMF